MLGQGLMRWQEESGPVIIREMCLWHHPRQDGADHQLSQSSSVCSLNDTVLEVRQVVSCPGQVNLALDTVKQAVSWTAQVLGW